MSLRRTLAAIAAIAASLLGQSAIAQPGVQSSALSPQTTFDNEDAAIIAATREYQRTGQARVLQVGTYLVFPFNLTQQTLTCAPLRTCTIQLQEGEKPFLPYPGDAERWFVGTSPGPRGTMLVVVQPSDCNLTTSLTIPTDRRLYQLTLDSPPCTARDTAQQNPDLPYTRLMRFYYPQELAERLAQAATANAAAETAREQREIPVEGPSADPTDLDFAYYTCRDRGFPWAAEQVFSDRAHTYVRVPETAIQGPRPLLFSLTTDGRTVLINYVQRGAFYVADRVLDRAVLITAGARPGEEQRLLITKTRSDCYRR
jgi:P-type conjugative transfer protein TrbG